MVYVRKSVNKKASRVDDGGPVRRTVRNIVGIYGAVLLSMSDMRVEPRRAMSAHGYGAAKVPGTVTHRTKDSPVVLSVSVSRGGRCPLPPDPP